MNQNLINNITPEQIDTFLSELYFSFSSIFNNNNKYSNHYYNIANKCLLIKYTGTTLYNIFDPALAHIALPNSFAQDFTIYLCDSTSTNIELPYIPWLKTGKIIKDFSKDKQHNFINLNYNDLKISIDTKIESLSVINISKKYAYFWIKNPTDIPWWMKGSPLITIISEWLAKTEVKLIHTAAVGTEKGVVLLTGKGGSGKTTTTLTCLESGLQSIGEDYCLIQMNPEPYIFTLYNSAKLTENTLKNFPQYTKYITNLNHYPEDKALLFHHQIHPQKILRSAPIKAILKLHINNTNDTYLSNISAAALTRELAFSTILQQAGIKNTTLLSLVAKLTQNVPFYQLNIGTEFEQIPKVIVNLLNTL
jgi:hypothetical protein